MSDTQTIAPCIVLSAAQLLEAVYFSAPDYPRDPEQLETEVSIGHGDGHAGPQVYCWLTDCPEEGSAVLDGASAPHLRQPTFQERVQPWLMACFGEMIAGDREERNHRFFEEATELVQARGMSASEAHQLVDYVYGRPVGEAHQEVGGVMVTLAALCLANGLDMHEAGETELARIWTKVEKIRAKQAAKPKHSPLPEHVTNANIADQAAVSYAIDALRHAQLCIACERASCDSDERGQWDRYQHAINGLLGHAAQPETKA